MDDSDVIDGWVQARSATCVPLTQGALLVGPDAVAYGDYSGSMRLRVGTACQLELHTRFAADVQLVMPGAVEEYRVSVLADVVCLSHVTRGMRVRLNPGCGVRELCFADGVVVLEGMLRRDVHAEATAPYASAHTNAVHSARLVAGNRIDRPGAARDAVRPGVLIEVSSREGRDIVYGVDRAAPIVLKGRFVDFDCRQEGQAISLARRTAVRRDVVHVLGNGGLVFEDGRSNAEALRGFLRGGPQIANQARQANPLHVTAVALSLSPCGPWTQSVLGELNDHAAVGDLLDGQVIEAEVSFNKPLLVIGVPRIELRFGAFNRLAVYVAGSGSDTLRFAYTVTTKDIESLEQSLCLAESAEALRASSIEVGHLVTYCAVLLEVSGDSAMEVAGARLQSVDPYSLGRAGLPLDIDLDTLEAAARTKTEHLLVSATGAEIAGGRWGADQTRRDSSFVFTPSGFGSLQPIDR